MLAYSSDAEPGRAFLLRRYNDIDIFVEDAAAQNVYLRLFRRILDGIATVNNVFPLHNRKNVITKCSEDQAGRPRKRLYIIDGDFDAIQGEAAPSLDHLHRLNVYCVENLLLSERAALEVAAECATCSNLYDLALQLDLRRLFDRAYQRLMPLFIVYAVAHKLDVDVKTSSYPVQRLCAVLHDPETLSGQLIRARISQVRTAILAKVSLQTYRALRKQFLGNVGGDASRFGRLISGKTYLLPLLQMQLSNKVRFCDSADRLKVRLAANCELTIDPDLVTALLNAAA